MPKIFPWTEIVPDIPEGYLWDCIDTEIMEVPDLVSLCETGLFRILARVHFGGVGELGIISHLRTQFHSRPNIVSDISSDANAERELASDADIIFDLISEMPDDKYFTSTADIVSSIGSDANAERELASTTNITSFISSHMPDHRHFASGADMVFDISDPVFERAWSFASQADFVFDIDSDLENSSEFVSQADFVFDIDSGINGDREFASTADFVFDMTADIDKGEGEEFDWGSFTGDTFTGDDDDPLNSVVWEDQAEAFEWLIQSNEASCDITTGLSSEALSHSTFTLSGDFDFQIDFNSALFTNNGFFRIYALNGDQTYGSYVGITFDASHTFNGNFKTANNWDTSTSIARTNDYGQLRIFRIGTQVTLQYKDGAGSFTTLVIDEYQTAEDVKIQLQMKTGEAAGDRVSGNFDNFLITSGTVVGPSSPSLPYDDFTGTNGDPLHTDNWLDSLDDFSWEIQDNKAYCNITAGDKLNAISESAFRIYGDFDVQIDFDSFAVTTAGFMRLLIINEGLTDGQFMGIEYDVSGHEFRSNFKTDDVWGTTNEVARTNDFGKLRLNRVGDIVYCSYQDGAGGWTALGSKTQSTESYIIKLHMQSGNAVEARVSGNFDNFQMNTGEIADRRFIGDNFIAADGSSLDTNLWTDAESTNEWLIQNAACNVNEGANLECLSISTFTLAGDFKVDIRFDSIITGGTGSLFRILVGLTDLTYMALVGVTNGNFHGNFKMGGVWGTQSTVGRSNDYGEFRYTRTGSNLTIAYRDGINSWNNLMTKVGWNTGDVEFRLHGKTVATGTLSGNYDNFFIEYGKVIWP